MLLRNTLFNLIGLGAPLLAALATIPVLIAALGPERFGLLTLVWAVVGYFGLFDLGLARALTLHVAAAIGQGRSDRVGILAATTLALLIGLGVLAALALAAAAPWGIAQLQGVADPAEALRALRAMAWALPFIVATSGFRAILEARHRFFALNALRLPLGIFTFVGPWAMVALGETRLDAIAVVLAWGRVVGCAAHAAVAWRALPGAASDLRLSSGVLPALFTTGGWVTVSTLLSPLMTYVDRFIVGAVISAAAVAYFATPQEIVSKLWIVPAALTGVLFPRIAEAGLAGLAGGIRRSVWRGAAAIAVVIYPIALALFLFAHEILATWIDPEFAAQAAIVLQCFAIGILANAPAHIPFTLLQAVGRARTVALLHAAEVPAFVALTWWLATHYALVGAGIAWAVRCAVDAALLFWFARGLMSDSARIAAPALAIAAAGMLLAAAPFAGVLLESAQLRAGLVAAALLGAVAWFAALWRARDQASILGELRSWYR
ncbi:MAG TPA: oligosaccharide flippase family protein [Burkholderiaceae bacterium]|nr:oligosaccharide flippase family protein [Burkholderiaceae bacterium]